MTIQTLEPFLAEHPFFSGLDSAYVKFITGCAKNVVFNAGDFLFKQGANALYFFVIREGKVAVEVPALQGGSIRISTVGKGEILGWSWLMPPHTYKFDTRALEKTRVISLDGNCLRNKCDEDPVLGYELMKRFSRVMTERLQETRMQLLDFYGNPQNSDTADAT